MRKIVTALAAVAMLSACTLSNEQQASAAKAYDKICSSEPQLYAAFVVVATAKGASEAKLAKVATYHDGVTKMCDERPTDIVAALVTLSGVYAQIVAANGKL